MAAKSVDQISITNWTVTGSSPAVPQFSAEIYVRWTDEEGVIHTHEDTYLFPNELADIPLAVLREFMGKIIMAKVRVTLGVDTWDDYS